MKKALYLYGKNCPMATRVAWVIVLATIAAFLPFREAIVWVFTEVLNRSDSSHGVFVPFMAAYFVWFNKDRIDTSSVEYSWIGILPMMACFIVALSGIGGLQIGFIMYVGLICSLVLTILGKTMLKSMAFPILFLITMTPLSEKWYETVANFSRTIAFGGSLKIISLLGIPYLRDGWDIELPNALLRVSISCSGVRYLISFIVFGLAYAYLFKSSALGRFITVGAAIPISLFASISRLSIIFMMTYWISPYWAQPRPHIIVSWFVFLGVLSASILIDQAIQHKGHSGK